MRFISIYHLVVVQHNYYLLVYDDGDDAFSIQTFTVRRNRGTTTSRQSQLIETSLFHHVLMNNANNSAVYGCDKRFCLIQASSVG